MFKKFLKDQSGATAIEYGILAAVMAVTIIAVLPVIGDVITAAFAKVTTAIGGITAPPAS